VEPVERVIRLTTASSKTNPPMSVAVHHTTVAKTTTTMTTTTGENLIYLLHGNSLFIILLHNICIRDTMEKSR
jgi:hypothetical protein